jgi:hypothetical protein
MEIFRQQNCKLNAKYIVLILTVVGTVIATSICKEDGLYE